MSIVSICHIGRVLLLICTFSHISTRTFYFFKNCFFFQPCLENVFWGGSIQLLIYEDNVRFHAEGTGGKIPQENILISNFILTAVTNCETWDV